MAYTVSASYHTAIKDGVSPQDFMLSDRDAVFNILSTTDGDFVAGSPSISRSVCESQDFVLGECPSATLSATLANPYGDGIEFWSKRGTANLGTNVWARAGIGVRLSTATPGSSSPAAATNKCGIALTFGSTTKNVYVNSNGRLYINTSYNSSQSYSDAMSIHARYVSSTSCLVYIGMASGKVYTITVTSSTTTVPSSTEVTSSISGPMVRRMQTRGAVVYDAAGFPKARTVYDTDSTSHTETWEYCPVGLYFVKVPKYNLHSATIAITDAMDPISLLDCNLKELAEANSITLEGPADSIVNAICTAKGIAQASAYSNSPYTITVGAEAITSDTTCRQFFRWVGERAGHLWKVDPIGRLATYTPPAFSDSDYTLTDEYLVAGYEIYNEFVDKPEKFVVYYGDDKTYTSQASTLTRDDYLKITGNPLYVSPDSESPEMPWLTYSQLPFPSYQIVDCTSVSADPSYGYGDAIKVTTTADYQSYIMRETITFGIRAVAHYVASGSNTRTDTESQAYTGMMISSIGEQVDDIAGTVDTIGDQIPGIVDQTIQDAVGPGGIIGGAIATATEGLVSQTTFESTVEGLTNSIITAATIQEWISSAIAEYNKNLTQFLEWDDVKGLSLKAKDEEGQQAPTYLNLINNRLAFFYGESMPAWMTSDTFNINNLIVQNSASILGLIMQKVDVSGVTHLRLS